VIKSPIDDARYDVVFAANGRETLRAFEARSFEAILMDISMPVLDGYQATKAIRALEREQMLKRTPIIALTAHAIEGQHEKSLDAGMDDCLAKPIKRRDLEAVLAKWAGAANPARDAA